MRAAKLVVPILFSITAYAQAPVISPNGIVNTASYTSPALPGGAIARGSMFSIYGQNLGPAALAQASSLPFATSLSGVSVRITQGTTAVDAIPVAVIASSVTAIMPSNAPLGLASLQVTNNGARSNPSPVTIVNSSFGIFARIGGQGPGTILNVDSETGEQTYNSPSTPARPGQLVVLFGTGLGPAAFPDNDTPVVGDLATPVEIFVGGGAVLEKLYSGRDGFPGVDQMIFTLPNDVPPGCWVPLQVRTGGVVSNAVTISISADGTPCSEPSNAVGRQLLSGGAIGVVGLTRLLKRAGFRHPVDQTVDLATVSLRRESASPLPFNPLFSFPPPGSCTVYSVAGDLFGPKSLLGIDPSGKYLNGGASFSVTGPGTATQTIQSFIEPLPLIPIGGKLQVGKKNTLILNTGNAAVRSPGGPEVGSFQASASMPPMLTWTNRDQILRIDRTKPLTLTWTGSPEGSTVSILGVDSDQSSNVSAAFLCVAPGGAASFTVPDYVLAGMPASRPWPFKSLAALFVGALPLSTPATFTANGLDLGVVFPVVISMKQVVFR